MPEALGLVEAALRALRAPVADGEYALHDLVAAALSGAGLAFAREARIGPGARVDFLCQGVAIEVKRGRPPAAALGRQLTRYASCEGVDAVLLVLERWVDLPPIVCGKPCRALSLRRLWGVALP